MVLGGCRQPSAHITLPSVLPELPPLLAESTPSEPAKPEKAIKQMSVEEAIEAAAYYAFINHQALLIAVYQHIIAKSKDPETVATYVIKLADLYFIDNNFDEAKKHYKKAITLYPGHTGIENARYREVLAHFLSSLSPARDQSATQTTINLGKKYLADFPQAEPDRVRSIIASAYKKLLQSELLVISFYLNKFRIGNGNTQPVQAALQRMINIVEILLPQLKIYDEHARTIQAQPNWMGHVFLSWDTLLTDNLDTFESRQEVIAKLDYAVSILQGATDNVGIAAATVSAADRF